MTYYEHSQCLERRNLPLKSRKLTDIDLHLPPKSVRRKTVGPGIERAFLGVM